MGGTCESSFLPRPAIGAHCPVCRKEIGIWPIFVARFLIPSRFGRCVCPHCATCLEFENAAHIHRIYLIASAFLAATVLIPAGLVGFVYETSQTHLIYSGLDLLLLSLVGIIAALIGLSLPLEWAVSACLRRSQKPSFAVQPPPRSIVPRRIYKMLLGLPLSLRIFVAGHVLFAAATILSTIVPIWFEQTLIWRVEQARGSVLGWRRFPELATWWANGGTGPAGIGSQASVVLRSLEVTDTELARASVAMQGFENLWAVDIRNTCITDSGLQHLAELKHLHSLSIEC